MEPFLFRCNSARIRQLGIRKPRELTLTIFMRLALKISHLHNIQMISVRLTVYFVRKNLLTRLDFTWSCRFTLIIIDQSLLQLMFTNFAPKY